ncbi:MAG TPA: hypothetical protein VFU31_21020 [Candidatus Binatia bacterium]|nr:hypothetical protein [Candidatus Binatia bacterium]
MNQSLIVAIPYCTKDVDLARKLLLWIAELGGVEKHFCLLGADSAVPEEQSAELKKIAAEAFGYAWTIRCNIGEVSAYQIACNRMFSRMANQIQQTCRHPFLWLEPDCVPVKKDWLDQLSDGYHEQPKRYLGRIIDSQDAKVAPADIKKHMAMVAVYPQDAFSDLKPYLEGQRAFDLAAHEFLVPRATDTKLIQQFFPPRDQMITFKAERVDEDPVNVRTPKSLFPETVLFHQSKDGTLIDVLRPQLIIPKDLSPDLRKAMEGKPVGRPTKAEKELASGALIPNA